MNLKLKTVMMFGLLFMANSVFANQHDQIIQTRQKEFKQLLNHFEPMGMMIRGSKKYNAQAFQKYSLALLNNQASNLKYFPKNSISNKSRAKKEIWENIQAYQKEQTVYSQRVYILNEAAKTGDLSQIRPKFHDVAASCKSCHDQFRLKKLPS